MIEQLNSSEKPRQCRETYPNEYDPQGGGFSSDSSMTLILTLRNSDKVKTVRAEDIALSYESDEPE